MTAIARPSTPFPHTHALHHFSTGSSLHSLSPPPNSYFARPLHFSPRELPIHTPPSLLKRNSSSSSTSNTHDHTHTRKQSTSLGAGPAGPGYRRQSTAPSLCESTTSEDESPMPQTPPTTQSDLSLIQELDFELRLPERAIKQHGLAMPEPQYNWVDKEITPTTSFDVNFDMPPRSRSPVQKLARPKFKRRDSPRPPFDFLRMSRRSSSETRVLRSAVDGGSWVILE